MAEVSTQRQNESKRIGGQINQAAASGLLTSAMIAANATITLLKAAITSAATAQTSTIATKTNKALDRGVSLGYIPATHGVTTVAGLLALTDAPSTWKQSFIGE